MNEEVGSLKEVVRAEEGEIYDIELDADILEANRKLADKNRELLQKYDVKAIDVMGATGSGKTSLIERIVQALVGEYRMAAFKGDLTTTVDAERIERHGAEAVPITTGKECHLDANLVSKALGKIDLKKIDLLFIENVGNLICPAEFPLGSEQRVVVVSVTEGPYMIIKHPFIFMDADVVAINKMDLADAMEVDIKKLEEDIKKINPGVKVAVTNCRSGEGVNEVIEALGLQ
ncbi:hydrogenase nickel incorporation protein HypB [Candidatus Bathyarchaeota archaeon]|nr:hydrogenase nickel incorporation protein HypB [Candidatus Bathyarchaeota archaeon]NIU80696.1 hydrogenase nickel incorporation protein HypB [Candidatus Bathyarchaeota archaeon]NIV67313.1 hydrogenase nickel incorporation protein HypB [Candidatus Bathyarchaeota archaeon]NIW16773.1 hydrogenase nickel incorporation protein HypB [Candidatus Bathyarchaeota archaeon]NIW33987.1 hydrogenase nickel incorporation protein HypB [Candidatus Bathyarchaeota archaeon]